MLPLYYDDLEDYFREYLDEWQDWPELFGKKYPPSEVLEIVDPSEYSKQLNNWIEDNYMSRFDGDEMYYEKIR